MDLAAMLAHTNPPLPPFPWLVSSEPILSATRPTGHKSRQGRSLVPVCAGIAAIFAVLCGGPAFLGLFPVGQPMKETVAVRPAQIAVAAVASAPVNEDEADNAALPLTPATIAQEAAPPAVMTQAAPQAASPASLIGPPPAVGQAIAAEPAPVPVPLPSPAADIPVSAGTMAEFRAVIEESRDTARQVIALASRQRPSRDASAEELTRNRLRQQNADAARGYRKYLDTLARSMRGSPSQGVGRQLLERAQQTRAYLATLLADSQASLR